MTLVLIIILWNSLMKFIKKYVKSRLGKISDFSFYSLLIIYVICAMSFGAYLNNGIIKPTLTSLYF